MSCFRSSSLRARRARQSNALIWRASLFVILFWGLAMTGVQAQEISIGLYDKIDTLYLTANKDYEVNEDLDNDSAFNNSRTMSKKKIGDRALIRSSPAAANSLLIAAEPDLVTTSRIVEFVCKEDCLFTIKHGNISHTYRGSIVIKPQHDYFTVINRLDLEDYLQGVVPAEMPSTWHSEALKAQAVAARTYSLSMLGRRNALGYDLKSSVEDQVYLGYDKEKHSTNAAIKASQGEYLINQQGSLVNAYFSSMAGRYSASPEEGWGISPEEYLVPRKEPANASRGKWQMSLSQTELDSKLEDLQIGTIETVTVVNRSIEGRATQILLGGIDGFATLTGEEFRHQLGLRSTDFRIHFNQAKLRINGFGFGHGIGMSQYGAKAFAETGKNYQEILGHYYTGARLVTKQ